MAFVSHAVAMALSAVSSAAPPGEPASVRCRPAPYIVSERAVERPRKQTLALESRAEVAQNRNGRPCLLMRGEADRPSGLKIAALS